MRASISVAINTGQGFTVTAPWCTGGGGQTSGQVVAQNLPY